ncbi:MAG TPA: hypothetical protein VHA52_11925, partial [Candidatus Babeliaceae bacterium]|nr:hypothetical protein [Candidatus Babeliaceae bacterium]
MNIAIISPSEAAYSETFIHAHISLLKGNKKLLFNGYLPVESDDGVLKIRYSIFNRLMRRLFVLLKFKKFDFHRNSILNYLRRNDIDVVLAEYGLTGAEMANICAKANIPLVVHFHGFDAYKTEVLLRYEKLYKQM